MKVYYAFPLARPNQKTGRVVQQYIGADLAESRRSCSGCPLLESETCYAQYGTVAYFGLAAILHEVKNGKDYSLHAALTPLAKSRGPKYVRFGALGEPASIPQWVLLSHIRTIRKLGIGILAYTHFWRSRGKHLLGHALASCDSWQDVKEAVRSGWRTALHLPKKWVDSNGMQGKFDGMRYTVCPADRTSKRIQCRECGLCDATVKTDVAIVFIDHGPLKERKGKR